VGASVGAAVGASVGAAVDASVGAAVGVVQAESTNADNSNTLITASPQFFLLFLNMSPPQDLYFSRITLSGLCMLQICTSNKAKIRFGRVPPSRTDFDSDINQ